MNDYVGIVRSKMTLSQASELVSDIDNGWEYKRSEYYSDRLKSLKTIAGLIIKGALSREETRGSQIRIDFPEESKQAYNIFQSLKSGMKKKYL